MKKNIFFLTFSLFLVDQLIKLLVVFKISYNEVINIITNFFYLTHVKNYGAAWSIMNGNRIFLVLVGFSSLFIIYKLFLHEQNLNKLETITYSMLLGGIIGNLIDRVFRGFVVDYIGITIYTYKFPIFNLADMLIVISVILISYSILIEGEQK